MAQATNYDAIVIGSSRGGRLLPTAFAKACLKVALIERGDDGQAALHRLERRHLLPSNPG
jgi:choline dehydrogenase-like flavoprotein